MITKRMIGSLLIYGGLGATVIVFVFFRVVHLHNQYKDLEGKLLTSKQQCVQSHEDIVRAKKLLSLVQENAQRLSKEHEQALVTMIEKRNQLHSQVKFLKTRSDRYERQLQKAQQAHMPKQQLIISKALLDEKFKNLLKKAKQASS